MQFSEPKGLHFDALPFITGVRETSTPFAGIKERLPFSLSLRHDISVIAQISVTQVDEQLRLAYETGSMISTPLGEGDLNSALSDELFSWIRKAVGGIEGKEFLEPGCGTGFLLRKLKDGGARSVLGYEPGPQAEEGKRRFGVEIIKGFFQDLPSREKFDCVYHYGVLEHIKDPLGFLSKNMELVKPSGIVFVACPGCRRDFEIGNFMVLAHEHYNYFTERSLESFLRQCGLEKIEVHELAFSPGIICGWGMKKIGIKKDVPPSASVMNEEGFLLEKFSVKTKSCLNLLQRRVKDLENQDKSIGLYGSPRSLAGLLIWKRHPRVFDGDAFKYGKYFSGSARPIEPPQKLIQDPVDELWILPVHHDRAIRSFLKKAILPYSKIEIFSIIDFLEGLKIDGGEQYV